MADQSFFFSDFDDELGQQADGDIQRDLDVAAIVNSVRNIVLTQQGSRRMLPTFASNIQGLLFDPIDNITARLVAEGLLESLQVWEPRIEVTGFDIEPRPDQNFYRCRLSFQIIGLEGEDQQIDFILTR
jgi:phage baseplate assembly protein W